MVQFEFTDDGVMVAVSAGAGDLKAKITYDKIPTVKTLPAEERVHFAALLEVVISHLELQLTKEAHTHSMGKLKALQPQVIAPDEKKLILPGG